MKGFKGLQRLKGPKDLDFIVAAIVAAIAGFALLAEKRMDPNHDAARYYSEQPSKAAYNILKLCKVVLFAALAFNARYVLVHGFYLVFQKDAQ